jgi:uncharacterized phage-like protein YoqJ
MIISFTGHRPDKIFGKEKYIFEEIEKKLVELKPDKIISGMAVGVDQIAACVAVKLSIPFIAAVPFEGQEKIWPKEAKAHYNHLLSKTTEIKIVCEGGFTAWKFQKRNEWMVDNSDILIACWNGSSGGTANCVKYAEKIKKEIIYIRI